MLKSIMIAIAVLACSSLSFAGSLKPLSSVWTAVPGEPHGAITQFDMTDVNFNKIGVYSFTATLASGRTDSGFINVDRVTTGRCYNIILRDFQDYDPQFCTSRSGSHLQWFNQMVFDELLTNQTMAYAQKLSYVEFQ